MGPIFKSGITEDELVNFPNSKYADPVFSWIFIFLLRIMTKIFYYYQYLYEFL